MMTTEVGGDAVALLKDREKTATHDKNCVNESCRQCLIETNQYSEIKKAGVQNDQDVTELACLYSFCWLSFFIFSGA